MVVGQKIEISKVCRIGCRDCEWITLSTMFRKVESERMTTRKLWDYAINLKCKG